MTLTKENPEDTAEGKLVAALTQWIESAEQADKGGLWEWQS
jgi:hypothetical protein